MRLSMDLKPQTKPKVFIRSQQFKEGSLIREAGAYAKYLDSGAPNLFNNKQMLRDSLIEKKLA